MDAVNGARALARGQGAWFAATGIWPVLHLRSFEAVTGPKPEGWLVKTVGGLIGVVGAGLLLAARRERVGREWAALAAGSALVLAAVDVWYAGVRRRISPIYLADAPVELGLALGGSRSGAASPEGRMARKLEVYERKRHFDVTPEPPPDADARPRRAGAATFMVHKHHARRLHYDLRLELEGVLASWAVPKGPSFDPAIRRLAVETEDHPLAYGAFEGRIPDGEYGAGDSIIWDRGTWETVPPGQARRMKDKGHLEFVLRGEKLRGRWHLVRTGRPGDPGKTEWLLFKAKDEAADAAFDVTAARPESVVSGRVATRGPVAARTLRAPHPAPLELLLRVWPPPDRAVARGGRRVLAGVSGGRVSLQSADGLDLAPALPAVARGLSKLVAGEVVIDGDAKDGRLLARDLLWLDGADLRARPAAERRELLESLLAPPPPAVEAGPMVRGARASRGRARA